MRNKLQSPSSLPPFLPLVFSITGKALTGEQDISQTYLATESFFRVSWELGMPEDTMGEGDQAEIVLWIEN